MPIFVWVLPLFIYCGIAAQLAGIILCCILGPLILMLQQKSLRISRQWQHIAVLLFFIWAIFPFWNILKNYDGETQLKILLHSHVPSGVAILSLGLMLLSLVSKYVERPPDQLRFMYSPSGIISYFFNGCFFSSVVITAYLLFQHYTGFDYREAHLVLDKSHQMRSLNFRVKGFYGHPLSVSAVFLGLLFFFTHIYTRMKKIRAINIFNLRMKVLGICGMSFINLIISGGRAALIIGIFGVLFYLIPRIKKIMNFSFFWKAFLGVPILALIFVYSGFLSRFSGMNLLSLETISQFPRVTIWKLHWQLFLESPWFGYSSVIFKTIRESLYVSSGNLSLQGLAAHNIILQTLCEIGIVGSFIVACCLVLIVKSIRIHITKSNKLSHCFSKALFVSFFANFAHGMVQNTFYDTHVISLYVGLFFVVLWVAHFEKNHHGFMQKNTQSNVIVPILS